MARAGLPRPRDAVGDRRDNATDVVGLPSEEQQEAGLVTYCFFTVVFALTVIPEALSGKLGSSILDKMKSLPNQDPAMIRQATEWIQSGQGVIMLILAGLAFLFVCIISLSMAGGALGAKIAGRS